MKKVSLFVLLFVSFVGCDNARPQPPVDAYPQAAVDAFIAACVGRDTTKVVPCRCNIEKIQAAYTYREFRDISRTDALPDKMLKIQELCMNDVP